jgi:hypothetical protein
MAAALFDAQGCLSPQGFAQISAAPPGQAPPELAAHLAGCMRCQRRLLATALPSSGPRRERPPVWRTALVIVVCLGLVLLAMTLTRILNAPPR